jgi:hypothetical protein
MAQQKSTSTCPAKIVERYERTRLMIQARLATIFGCDTADEDSVNKKLREAVLANIRPHKKLKPSV